MLLAMVYLKQPSMPQSATLSIGDETVAETASAPVADRFPLEPDTASIEPVTAVPVPEADGDRLAFAERMALMELRIAELEAEVASLRDNSPAADTDLQQPGQDDRVTALVGAGFDSAQVAQLEQLVSTQRLQRLELRDRATREGWLQTEQFRTELRAQPSAETLVREQLGDDQFDRYLYTLGQSNRVSVDSIFSQSAAQQAGLLAGDVVISYAGERIYRVTDLQQATTLGQRGEEVSVVVQRSGEELELYIPRGPLGITIEGQRANPDEEAG